MLQKAAVLPELLTLLIDIQKSGCGESYILAGGTALALQLGHRESEDIDLFTAKAMDQNGILTFLQNNYDTHYDIYHNETGILQTTINNIKVDFVSYPVVKVENQLEEDGITLFGLKDIAAMKLRAIASNRNKAKDYIDICYLLNHHTLHEMFEFYKIKYACTDITNVKKSLTESYRVNPYEWENIKMIKHDVFLSDIPKILRDEIIKYNKEQGIKPKGSWFTRSEKKTGDHKRWFER